MDDFRIGSIPSYDPIHRHSGDDSEKRKKRKHSESEAAEGEDIVSLSENSAEADDSAAGYSPSKPDPGK